MKINKSYKLLTFYQFIDIENPQEEVKKLKRFTEDIGIKGRIYIGEEGINATCTCNTGQYQALMLYLNNNKYFNNIPDIEEKINIVDEHKFKKMIVRYRKEIVALGAVYKSQKIEQAKYKIKPEEFKEIIDKAEEDKYLILDMRNDYEYKLGHFKYAHPAGTMTFKETKEWIEDYKKRVDDKEVIMYCTGGIRCEKLAALLEDSGMNGVKQLDGGIVKYLNKFNDGNWLGNLYTFDDRVSTPVGDENTHRIIAKCHYSDEATESMHNCRYGICNKQIIAKPKYYKKYMGFCSESCYKNSLIDLNIRDVEFDEMNYKELRWKVREGQESLEIAQKIVGDNLIPKLSILNFKYKTPPTDKLLVDDYIE